MKNKIIIGLVLAVLGLVVAIICINAEVKQNTSIQRMNVIRMFKSSAKRVYASAERAENASSQQNDSIERNKKRLREMAAVYYYDVYYRPSDELLERFPKSYKYVKDVTRYCLDSDLSNSDEILKKLQPFVDITLTDEYDEGFYKDLEQYLEEEQD